MVAISFPGACHHFLHLFPFHAIALTMTLQRWRGHREKVESSTAEAEYGAQAKLSTGIQT